MIAGVMRAAHHDYTIPLFTYAQVHVESVSRLAPRWYTNRRDLVRLLTTV